MGSDQRRIQNFENQLVHGAEIQRNEDKSVQQPSFRCSIEHHMMSERKMGVDGEYESQPLCPKSRRDHLVPKATSVRAVSMLLGRKEEDASSTSSIPVTAWDYGEDARRFTTTSSESSRVNSQEKMESSMNDASISETRKTGSTEKSEQKEITEVTDVVGLRSAVEYLTGNRKAVKIKQCDGEGNRDLGISDVNPSRRLSRGRIGLPAGYVPKRRNKLPQVSETNQSKNDMSAPLRTSPGPENEFWGEKRTAVELMREVCSSFSDWEDVINFRRCCSTFAEIGASELRNRFACRITKRFALYFWRTFHQYAPEEMPYIRYQLAPKWIISSPVDMSASDSKSANTDELMQNILRRISPNLICLRFDEVSITGGLSTLRNLLFEYAPEMEELLLFMPDFVVNEAYLKDVKDGGGYLCFDHGPVIGLMPKVTSVSSANNPRLRLRRFEYQAKADQFFPLRWDEVFKGFPKLECLKVRELPAVEMVELVQSLVINEEMPLRKFNMFRVASDCPDRLRLEILLPLYERLPFRLTELELHLLACVPWADISRILSSQSATLQDLTLTRQQIRLGNYFGFAKLFESLHFPNLKRLRTTNDIFPSFSFLHSLPALVELTTRDSDPTDNPPSRVICPDLFHHPDSRFVRAQNLETLILPKCLKLPIIDAKVAEALQFNWNETFPWLRTLELTYATNDSLRLIFKSLKSLRELHVVGEDVNVTDEGIIGFSVGPYGKIGKSQNNAGLFRGGKGPTRDFPCIADVPCLRSVTLGNETMGLSLTKLSLELGFSKCKYLCNLTLYGTKIKVEDLRSCLHDHPSILIARVGKGPVAAYTVHSPD